MVGEQVTSKGGIRWPSPAQFNEAIQNLSTSMADDELRGGTAASDAMGMPLLYSGGFADVYEVHCESTDTTWAVKCFTKGAAGLRERYREIGKALDAKSLPFTVDFEYQEKGIRITGDWYPIVKMRWVEGRTLNEFIAQSINDRSILDQLFKLWVKLAERLDREGIAHADLQHGNVILVPQSSTGRLLLKLIDYDGMWTPSLSETPSGELGHANYQHPQRKTQKIYSATVDRFSHLVICCALRCLCIGGQSLWKPCNNGENLLFTEADFDDPAKSSLFRELWTLSDADAHAMVGHLILATRSNLDRVPPLHELVDDQSRVRTLTRPQVDEVNAILAQSKSSTSSTTSNQEELTEAEAGKLAAEDIDWSAVWRNDDAEDTEILQNPIPPPVEQTGWAANWRDAEAARRTMLAPLDDAQELISEPSAPPLPQCKWLSTERNVFGKWLVRYDCPTCGLRLRSPISNAGQPDQCPRCHCRFLVPGEEIRVRFEQIEVENTDQQERHDHQAEDEQQETLQATLAGALPPVGAEDQGTESQIQTPQAATLMADTVVPCPFCRVEIPSNAPMCQYCGKSFNGGQRSNVVAGILGIFLGPVGLWYKGHVDAGIIWLAMIFFICAISDGLGLILVPFLWIAMAMHAILVPAKRTNR